MDKSVFFLWLNDTTHDRYYWSQRAQNWTTDYADATKFATRELAEYETSRADQATKAEIVVQEILVPA
jgi:hypothetical protein